LTGLPAQPGPDAGHQLLGREGLGDVVVGPGLEPEDDVHGVGLGRQHHDGHAGLQPQLTADLEPVLARQHEVEQDQVGLGLVEGGDGLVAGADEHRLEALLTQDDPEHLAQRRVVVDDQYPALHVVRPLPSTDNRPRMSCRRPTVEYHLIHRRRGRR
jgi:hypothetical protein